MALYYRADILKQDNIAVPTTWAEFQADAVKVHALDPSVYLTNFSTAMGDIPWFAGLCSQAGAKWFNTSGSTWDVSLDDPACAPVTSYWQSLIDNKDVKVEANFSDAWNTDLATGKLLSLAFPVWEAGGLESAAPKTSGDWAVAPMPQWTAGGASSGNWGGSAMAVTPNSKQKAAATAFLIWLDSDPAAMPGLIKIGLYPASYNGLKDPTLNSPQAFYNNQDIDSVFTASSKDVDTSWVWGPTIDQTLGAISDNFGKAVDQSGTLASSLAAAQTATVAYMKQQGFSVSGS